VLADSSAGRLPLPHHNAPGQIIAAGYRQWKNRQKRRRRQRGRSVVLQSPPPEAIVPVAGGAGHGGTRHWEAGSEWLRGDGFCAEEWEVGAQGESLVGKDNHCCLLVQ